MRKKKSTPILVSILILLTLAVHAQIMTPALVGSVLDSEHKAPAGVTITLHRLPDSVLVATALSDSGGHFFFNRVPPGNYFLEFESVNYQVFHSGMIGMTEKHIVLQPFILTAHPSRLAAVTVHAPPRSMEATNGKLVFNVDKSIAAGGSNAFELLKKTPGIAVDPDDNLLMKGSSAITIMLDGKMTYLSPQQLTTFLKGMPAEDISRIEVITTPGSQYDAAGNAGVLNIVTQRSNKQGYALNLGGGIGTGKYPQTAENMIGNVHVGHFNFFGSYNYAYSKWFTDRTSHRVITDNGVTTIFDRESAEPVTTNVHNYKAGVELNLSPKEVLSFVFSGNHALSYRDAHGPTRLSDGSMKVDSVVQNSNVTHDPNISQTYTLSYLRKMDTLGKQWSVDADYSHYDNNSVGYLGNQLFTPGGNPLQAYQELSFRQPTLVDIRTAKTDLVLPYAKTRWTGGLKFASVTTDNNFVYDSLIGGAYLYSSALSNHFRYIEKIYAAYASFHAVLGVTELETGLRVEKTVSTGTSLTTGQVTNRNYTDLFPYLNLTRSLDENNTLSFSLTRRVNRPLYNDLNPFLIFLDKYTYLKGNPYLRPEYAWTGSLNYVWQKNYIATVTYARTEGAIIGFAQQDSSTGVLRITDDNYSHKDAFDVLLVTPFSIGKWWTIQQTADLSYLSYASTSGSELFRTSKWSIDLLTTNTFALPHGYAMELSLHYTSPTLAGVYVNRHYFTVDGGWKKTLFSRKLDLKLAFTDLFRSVRLWGYSIYKDANVRYYHLPDTRRVNLSVVYHFGGNLNVRAINRSEEQDRVQ